MAVDGDDFTDDVAGGTGTGSVFDDFVKSAFELDLAVCNPFWFYD